MFELLAAGVRPREEEFLAELKGAAKTKSWEDALRLLDGLREAGYHPRPGAYACAIRYAGRGVVMSAPCVRIASTWSGWCVWVCVCAWQVILHDQARNYR